VSKTTNDKKDLIVLYTGNGKGKTTAALGMVTRALGNGWPVAVVQFIKGKWKTGEGKFFEALPEVDFHVVGRGFTWESEDLAKDRATAQEGWEKARSLIESGEYSLVVLDELTYPIQYEFIDLEAVLEVLRERPKGVNVVITGRDASKALVEVSDLVTEMREVKHPFQEGVPAQRGIDF